MSFFRNTYFNNFFYPLTRRALFKNHKFKDIHKGEKCYIFGNGASIKYFDLAEFNDRIAITCGAMFLHKDYQKLNVKYYYTGHPFFYYPYWTNPYNQKFERNRTGLIYKKNIYARNDIDYFINLTNYFGISGKNVHFLYRYGQLFSDIKGSDLTGKYTFMDSALSAMIGIAIYMGFEDITLVGCDYASSPILWGHFFEFGKRPTRDNGIIYAEQSLLAAKEVAELKTITINPEYKGDIVKETTYKSFTNNEINYEENYEIVDQPNLLELNKTNMGYRIFPEK